ncbi:MAG: Re/Si-specific NAD(P)(+) transhydrogenase subunit alpha [Gammaproteobacteria bacterium]|nr:Re/Si-specific NAD(P)(+) transhydrogenase subunit alpha [Gammaproteobacteria bacterium]
MPIRVGVARETVPGERRVALVPETVARLVKQGFEVLVEAGSGTTSYCPDRAYTEAGGRLVADGAALCRDAEVVVKVQAPTTEEIAQYRRGLVLVSYLQPHRNDETIRRLRDQGVTSFAMELVPRITRAQSMDALSSQGTVAGYKAALIAADLCPQFFPMLTTAAGTIRPAKVLVLGAGVAGLQAIATARRLGAVIEAYDVRRAAREQVESLGAKFLQVELDAEAEGGYARELTAEEKEREQVLLRRAICQADVVITTAQIPGRTAPQLIAAATVESMKPGAVILDLAAESGGNCAVTRPGEKFEHHGVTVYGPLNVPSMLPVHASAMYSKNIQNFMGLLQGEGGVLHIDWADEILAMSAVTHDGAIRHAATRERIEGGAK